MARAKSSKFGKWGIIGGAIAGGAALISLVPVIKRRAMRVTTILKKDHRMVSGLIMTLQMTPRVNGKIRRTLFDQIDVTSIPNRELYAESLRRLNNLAQYRRLRIFAGNDTNPPVIWLVLLVGGVFAVCYTFFFGMKNIKAQYLITTTLTAMITSILFLIYVLDHPFTGSSRVSLEPLREAMAVMQQG